MKKKRRNIFSYVILSVWSLIIIGILGWVLMSSFKTNLEIYQTPLGNACESYTGKLS